MARTPGSHTQRHPVKTARQRAWNAMRVHKMFSALAIKISADINEHNLCVYLRALHRVGYVRQDRPKQNGKNGGCVIWRLVGYTGPHAPIVRQDQSGIYDPNTERFVPYQAIHKPEATRERLSKSVVGCDDPRSQSEENPTYGCAQRNLA